jgi:2Fe-2S ferredoxin
VRVAVRAIVVRVVRERQRRRGDDVEAKQSRGDGGSCVRAREHRARKLHARRALAQARPLAAEAELPAELHVQLLVPWLPGRRTLATHALASQPKEEASVPRIVFRSNRHHGDLAIEVPEGTTILEASKDAGAAVGDACGGNCACSTCHVYVLAGAEHLSEQEDKEADRLDLGFDVRANSRLACQTQLVRGGEVVVEATQESLEAYENEHPEHRQHG